MLRNSFRFMFLFICVLILFPSCIKYYKLSKDEFPQGEDHKRYKELRAGNLRTVAIYDQFATKAIFDLLWLSDDVRNAYVNINSLKRGRDEQSKQAILRRQLEENKHWITIYVLADIRDKTHTSLNDKNSMWSLYLELTDGTRVTPISIKESEVDPEYQFLFGHRFNLFKRGYVVKFPATDLTGKEYLNTDEKFELVISSAYKEQKVSWPVISDEVKNGEKEGEDIKEEAPKKKERDIYKDDDFFWV